MPSLLLLLFIISPIIYHAQASGTSCYAKGGELASSDTGFAPCRPEKAQTHCCDYGQTCVSNGLCFVSWDSSLNTGSCTDPTWQDEACFQLCDTFATLFRCSNNDWCCANGGNTTSCCDDEGVLLFKLSQRALIQNGTAFAEGVQVIDTGGMLQESSTTVSPSSTSTTAAAATSSPDASGDASSNSSSSSQSDRTMEIGLGIGLGMGLPLILLIGALSFLLYREKRRRVGMSRSTPYQADEKRQIDGKLVAPGTHEMHSHSRSERTELPT